MANLRKINAFVASILRGTRLIDVSAGAGSAEGFYARSVAGNGAWVQWDRTESRLRSEECLASLLVVTHKLNGISVDMCVEIIREALRAVVQDPKFFDQRSVFLSDGKSLFDALVLDFPAFSEGFAGEIVRLCSAGVLRHLMIVPVMPRLKGIGFSLPGEDVGIVDRYESGTMTRLLEPYFKGMWDKEVGFLERAHVYLGAEKFGFIAYSLDRGTEAWAGSNSYLKLRCLMAVLMAYFRCEGKGWPFHRVIAPAPKEGFQFRDRAPHNGWRLEIADPILPYLASDLEVDDSCVAAVQDWYSRLGLMRADQVSRLRKCAHFINLGYGAKGIVHFLFFYIALDALYGRRGAVESSIRRGISLHAPEYLDRAPFLFSLRNDLTHGGARSAEEWEDFQEYVWRFRGHPDTDASAIALKCLFRFAASPLN